MKNDPDLAQILRSLRETDKEDIVQEERARRQATRKSRVDTDLELMDADDGTGVSMINTSYFILKDVIVNCEVDVSVFLIFFLIINLPLLSVIVSD